MSLENLVTLPGSMDLDALDSVRDALLVALDRGPVTVSCRSVERISTNALLMLLSAAETARRHRVGFTVEGMSAPMGAAISRLGFDEPFKPLLRG